MIKGKAKLRFLAIMLCLCMALMLTAPAGNASEYSVSYTKAESQSSATELIRSDSQLPVQPEEPDPNELVRAILILENDSLVDSGFSTADLAQNHRAMVQRKLLLEKQNAVTVRIQNQVLNGQPMTVHHHFTICVNALAVTVPYGMLDRIAQVPGVSQVGLDPMYELPQEPVDPNTGTAGEMVHFYSTWADGYTGAESRIAIIDTGIDRDHPSFSEEGFLYGLATSAASQDKTIDDYDLLTLDEVKAILPELHVTTDSMDKTFTAEELYTNKKIPFGFNYLAVSADYNCDEKSGDHGCHVAGIAAANTYIQQLDADGDPYFSVHPQKVTGVAPNAQVIPMKVFSDGWGAFESNYMAAIEDAILLGCDAVNLSLGSASAGRSYTTGTQSVSILDSLMESDTVMSNSAGNNGAWADGEISGVGLTRTEDIRTNTGGSPGSYHQSFTVASADNIALTGLVGDYNGVLCAVHDTGANYQMDSFQSLDTSPDQSGTQYPYVFLGDPVNNQGNFGLEEDFQNMDFTGKIVLISRGNCSFFEKANRAVEHGALATVVYNNADGVINMNMTGYLYKKPAVFMTLADKSAVLAASVQNQETGLWEGTVTISGTAQTIYLEKDKDLMSDFSSWGCGDDLGLKPEITYPGGNIYSTLEHGSYGLNSGTSMAAPGVAGAAAVMGQYIRENDLTEKTGLSIRQLSIALMMSTARTMIDPETGLPYSPRQQGAGIVQLYEAVTSPAYLTVTPREETDGKAKLELGDDPQRTGSYTGSFYINNLTDKPLSYRLDSRIFTAEAKEIEGTEYMTKKGYPFAPQVTFQTDGEMAYAYDVNRDHAIDKEDARYLLRVANETEEPLKEDQLNLFDLDADGIITTTDAQLYLEALHGDTSRVDVYAITCLVPGSEAVKITFDIQLSQQDKEYLDAHYPNGGYVDGFLYARPEGGEGCELSLPLLAFYGNWSDSTIFEHWTLLEDENNENARSYIAEKGMMNAFSLNFRNSNSEIPYTSNNWATDQQYLADRNAINNRTSLNRVFPTLLRNADNLTVTIRNADTGEEYFTKDGGTGFSAYYSPATAEWKGLNTSIRLEWSPMDQEGERLEEGTKIEVEVRGVTEYNWQRNPEGGGTVKGELGPGAYWKTTMTVDNTAPEATSIAVHRDVITDERSVQVKVKDNRYTAAVLLLSQDGSVLDRAPVNQTELGSEMSVRFDLSEIYTSQFQVAVVDYAGNLTAYDVDIGGSIKPPDTNAILSVALSDDKGQWFAALDVDAQTVTNREMTPCAVPILSVTRASDGTLYAASKEITEEKYLVSTLYKVNETDYSLTPIGGTQKAGFTDMSWAPTVNGGALMATYGNNAMVVNTNTGEVEGAWDLKPYMGSATAVALTYVQTQPHETFKSVDVFLMMDSNGVLYQTGFTFDESTGKYTIFEPKPIMQIPKVYSQAFYGSSMYFQDGMLFISALSSDGQKLYSQLLSADLTKEKPMLFDRGQLTAAPVCIYGMTSAEGSDQDSKIVPVLGKLGTPVAENADLQMNLYPDFEQ